MKRLVATFIALAGPAFGAGAEDPPPPARSDPAPPGGAPRAATQTTPSAGPAEAAAAQPRPTAATGPVFLPPLPAGSAPPPAYPPPAAVPRASPAAGQPAAAAPAPASPSAPPQAYAPPLSAPPQPYAPPPPAPPQAYAPPPQAPPRQYAPPAPRTGTASDRRRDSWYIGFGVGTGAGQLRIGNSSYSARDLIGRSADTTSFNFRLGATVSPQLLIGFDGGALAARASGPDEVIQLNYYDLGVMFFPFQRGFFARAAVGRSVLQVESDGPLVVGKASYGGWNALAGGGYAFWLLKSFNLTLNVDYQLHSFQSTGVVDVKRGEGWSAWVGLDWY